MNITETMQTRYSTKVFDAQRTIPQDKIDQLISALRLSPSSVNSQPWHFIVAATAAGKRRLTRGTQGVFQANERKILDASHVVLFCARTSVEDDYLQHLLETEDADGRFEQDEQKTMTHQIRSMFVGLHRDTFDDVQHWSEKQVYLNMGGLLLGAASLGIDAVPIEGIDTAALNDEFNLTQNGFTAVAAVALGYRHQDDFNASLPKSRLPEAELFTMI
ncbi:oxygen-insensitive NAD(P)H nitroreductase [Marinobacterium weihaiense]|uniref:Oxygen-insensitive NAD(P)H nitroreductase n=1 Tax=Marinobacterium weihaiense TaxID=2851016 RepID=A0ABS6M745_9GAMM|nr:oxygen-insensitive NAD(P)H nitroreductase [Marinobacterium weihaiense]MBV0932113.1 oxygen-insensitive NAD(P)H nitroreductase [Marinobacterium weihaiense]